MTCPPASLETARLLLRMPTLEDAETIFQKYTRDPEVTRYLTWKPHTNVHMTEDFLRRCAGRWQDQTAFPWVVIQKKDADLVGMIELRIDGFRADLGYAIARPYWGHGYATEMTQAVVQWAIAQAEIYRVWATCDVENAASARVLEKAGMQREGLLRRYIIHPNLSAEPRDSYCYSLVK
jgi:[ribosomal protein S5]-alanine N-acetyltransferase